MGTSVERRRTASEEKRKSAVIAALEETSRGDPAPTDYFAAAGELILEGLRERYGIDITTPDFLHTPGRFAGYLMELLQGTSETESQVEGCLVDFPGDGFDEMVVAKHVWAVGLCPHHLAPIEYRISLGYIPAGEGKVLGLSKLIRMARILAARPVLHEQVSRDIVHTLMEKVGALGAGCVAVGRHGCMVFRGVQSHDSEIITSSMLGVFREDPRVREEFLDLVKG